MAYPFAGFGGFVFKREEHIIYGTDVGWVTSPSYDRKRTLGSARDVVTALSIGSAEREFEIYLSEERFNALHSLINTTSLFTDWKRPVPDSRQAFLAEVTVQEEAFSVSRSDGLFIRKVRVKVSLISA